MIDEMVVSGEIISDEIVRRILKKAINEGNINVNLNIEYHLSNIESLEKIPEMPGKVTPGLIDPRQKVIVYAKAKPTKIHVILWEVAGWNKVPIIDGGPFPILEHPVNMADRLFVPDGSKVLIRGKAQSIDGGGIAFEVLGFGSAAEIALEELQGSNLYIKKIELVT